MARFSLRVGVAPGPHATSVPWKAILEHGKHRERDLEAERGQERQAPPLPPELNLAGVGCMLSKCVYVCVLPGGVSYVTSGTDISNAVAKLNVDSEGSFLTLAKQETSVSSRRVTRPVRGPLLLPNATGNRHT